MKKHFLLIAAVGAIAGCSSATPDCSSGDARDLVLEITQDEMASYTGEEKAASLDYSLDAIRTRNHDEALDSYRCVAELTISGLPQGSVSDEIEYTIESTDEHGEFYIEVYGL